MSTAVEALPGVSLRTAVGPAGEGGESTERRLGQPPVGRAGRGPEDRAGGVGEGGGQGPWGTHCFWVS